MESNTFMIVINVKFRFEITHHIDRGRCSFSNLGFEKDVNMYGSQALRKAVGSNHQFEKDVNMYGSQADSN